MWCHPPLKLSRYDGRSILERDGPVTWRRRHYRLHPLPRNLCTIDSNCPPSNISKYDTSLSTVRHSRRGRHGRRVETIWLTLNDSRLGALRYCWAAIDRSMRGGSISSAISASPRPNNATAGIDPWPYVETTRMGLNSDKLENLDLANFRIDLLWLIYSLQIFTSCH